MSLLVEESVVFSPSIFSRDNQVRDTILSLSGRAFSLGESVEKHLRPRATNASSNDVLFALLEQITLEESSRRVIESSVCRRGTRGEDREINECVYYRSRITE